ncbi:hypothetical protein BgiMline_031392 [Biomphalaria glabrata]
MMKKEASFANFQSDVQFLDNDPKKVLFDRHILEMKIYQMKPFLLSSLQIDTTQIHPAFLDVVLVISLEDDANHEIVLQDNDRLKNYFDQLSQCHLIKVVKRRKSLKTVTRFCMCTVQDVVPCKWILGFLFLALAIIIMACLHFFWDCTKRS